MPRYFALLSIVFMMAFVLLFERRYWRRRYSWQCWRENLMSQSDTERMLKILAASTDQLALPRKEIA